MRTHRKIIGAHVVVLVLAACATGRDEPVENGQGAESQSEGAQTEGGDSQAGDTQAGSESGEGGRDPGPGEPPEGETGPGGDEQSQGDTETGGEAGTTACDDSWEPNASAEQPSMMTWQSADEWTAYRELEDAGLCAGEHDWYYFNVESLGYAQHYLYVRALVKNAGLCGSSCDQPVIPAGPEHAMTVEVYRADDVELLTSQTDDDGVLVINGPGGDAYANDLLIHVFSPTVLAEYPYRLSVAIRNYDGEDECEC